MLGSSPAASSELLGSCLSPMSLLTKAWRGSSVEAFMGVQALAAALLCFPAMSDSLLTAMDAVSDDIAELGRALSPAADPGRWSGDSAG